MTVVASVDFGIHARALRVGDIFCHRYSNSQFIPTPYFIYGHKYSQVPDEEYDCWLVWDLRHNRKTTIPVELVNHPSQFKILAETE